MGERHHSGLSPTARRIAKVMAQHGKPATRDEIISMAKTSSAGLNYCLSMLIDGGHIRTAGKIKRAILFEFCGETFPDFDLWPRDLEILTWISKGKTTPEVAQIMGRSENWIDIQVKRIYESLGVENRCGALGVAFRSGLIK